ncbi:MAG: hypothetical protein IJS57_05585 [Paludibacteraceae bacterium]|nr:hypothetical protein [Paludibacteraceae bacterium]
MHIDHKPYYHDRLTTWDLCRDFPEDEMYINGLHAMQSHFYTHNVPVEIPVVRVMNAAHFLLAYVFQTTCSDNQSEYDVLAYGSVGHDKKVMLLTLIVLAAMLKRTEGFRARMCRNMLLEDRSEDFYDGVSLYDQFLNSEEKHFAEEDFLLDTHNRLQKLTAQNEQLTYENSQLKNTLSTMEEKYTQIIGTQYKQDNNQGTIYNAPVTIQYITNPTEKNTSEPKQTYSEKEQVNHTKTTKKSAAEYEDILSIPNKGKYTEVRKYIEERCKFDEEFKEFVAKHTRVELCMRLTEEFGWDVDEHALGVNMNRNR